jgi:signal transduction histidine kinase
MRLTIGDNGSGFITTAPNKISSLGVCLIKDLSEEIGAICAVQSSEKEMRYDFRNWLIQL